MQVHVSPARFGLRDFASACNSVPSAMRISDRFKHVEDMRSWHGTLVAACMSRCHARNCVGVCLRHARCYLRISFTPEAVVFTTITTIILISICLILISIILGTTIRIRFTITITTTITTIFTIPIAIAIACSPDRAARVSSRMSSWMQAQVC